MNKPSEEKPIRACAVYNRLTSLMAHSTRYSIEGITRLAADAGVSPSAVSRLIRGDRRPAYLLVLRLVAALERELGVVIDPREVIREDPFFPTSFPCAVAGCSGCIPPWAYGPDDRLLSEFQGLSPGQWLAPNVPSPTRSIH